MIRLIVLCMAMTTEVQANQLTRRALNVVSRHIANTRLPANLNTEEVQQYYEEGKIVKLYDLEIYNLLTEAGLSAKSVDYIEAILQANGWVTFEVDSIVYAYPDTRLNPLTVYLP